MPLALRGLRAALHLLGTLSPVLAGRWVYRLWFRPYRFPEPAQEKAWRRTATPLAVQHRGQPLAVDVWGTGPSILLVHGWNGRGAQLGAFVSPLVQAGYRVVSFDTPAHGRSPGRATSLPEISEAIGTVARACGPLHALIGHSFGVACALNAIRQGLAVQRFVALSPPSDLRWVVQSFFDTLDVRAPVQADFLRRFEADFGTDLWQRYSPIERAREISLPCLVLHDEDDRDVPWQHGASLAEAWPGAQFVCTQGLGHRRILRDPDVLARVTAFITAS